MRTLKTLTLAACVSAGLFAQLPNEPAKPDPEINKLAVYLGEWTYEWEDKPTPIEPGGRATGRATAEMILRGFFLEWRWDAKGTAGPSRGVEILGYDPVKKVFLSRLFSDRGAAISSEFTVEKNKIKFAGKSVTKTAKDYEFRATEVFAADLMTFVRTEEISLDGKTWMPSAEGKFTKVTRFSRATGKSPERPIGGPNVEE